MGVRIVRIVVLLVVLGVVLVMMRSKPQTSEGVDLQAQAGKRIQARDRLPSEQNGFYDLKDDITVRIDSSNPTLPACFALGECWDASLTTTLEKVAKGGEHARLVFEDKLPSVRRAIEKPVFAPPSSFYHDYRTNLTIGTLCLEDSLICEAAWKFSHGAKTEAARDYVLALRLAVQLTKQGPVVTQMSGASLISRACASLLQQLDSGGFDIPSLHVLRAGLRELPVTPQDCLLAMDEELCYFDAMTSSGDDQQSAAERLIGGMLAQHMRGDMIAQYLLYRPCFQHLRQPQDEGLPESDDLSLSTDLKTLVQYRTSLSYLNATRVTAAMVAYRLEKRRWPPTLDALKPDELDMIPSDPVTLGGGFTYRLDPDGPHLISSAPLWKTARPMQKVDQVSFYPYQN
jgi:hypothetical protein